ncbi:MAG: hypothetical protein IT521_02300 [Burkholderiales bacterium]|nr:hypothetical protein [Burkholderiales bacterium]
MSDLLKRTVVFVVAGLVLAGCATTPPPQLTIEEEYQPELATVPTPLVEYPPIEPVEPPLVESAPAATSPAASPQPEPASAPQEQTGAVATAPPSVLITPPPVVLPPTVVEDSELVVLLADLQRYGALSPDEVKRELTSATQSLSRQRTDANRVRLAVLFTLSRANPQDDQRALQLLDNVAKNHSGSASVKQLAFVLHLQIAGRQRAVREEQQKADAALQKLEALRQMERSLLRDRVRSGGGGGGGGSGGSGGSGGGSGGSGGGG